MTKPIPTALTIWVRGPRQPDGRRPSLGVYDTEAEANAVLAHAVYELSKGAARDGSATFAAYGRRVLDLREEDGVRSVARIHRGGKGRGSARRRGDSGRIGVTRCR